MLPNCGFRSSFENLFNIIYFQMASGKKTLAGCIATHRLVGHLSYQLGYCIVLVSWTCLWKFNRNADNLSRYRSSDLRIFGELCRFAR